jgi:hypothetical protein
METTDPLRILAFAALTLSVRILTWLSLLGGTALFAYAVIEPTNERTIAAALYAVLVYMPSLLIERRRPVQRPRPAQNQPTDQGEVSYA